MPELQDIIRSVLKEIEPTKDQRKKLEDLSSRVLGAAKEEASKHKAEPMLAGSLTRDTWLVSKNEFDVFIVFPENIAEEELEKKGLEVGKKILEKLGGAWRVDYAQHPYIRGMVENVEIDVVPCYKVESGEKIKSAVDRTPFHVEYLNKKLPKEVSKDVRMLKHFLKMNGIYGADTKTEGFSGYICELLVINYGGFEKILKKVSEWNAGELIDIEGHWEEADHEKLRKKFKGDPLILIDPVDKNRNAAAAISPRSFFKFRKLARDLMEKPEKSYFEKRLVEPLIPGELDKILKERGTELLVLKFRPPDVVQDILWPQLRRFTKRLESILEEGEFLVLRTDFWSDEADLSTVVLELENKRLSNVNKRVGPSVFDKDGSENFIKKYKGKSITGPFVEDEFWCVELERPWTDASEKLKYTMGDTVEKLKAKGVPNYIAAEIMDGFKVLKGESIGDLLIINSGFATFLREYFEKEDLS